VDLDFVAAKNDSRTPFHQLLIPAVIASLQARLGVVQEGAVHMSDEWRALSDEKLARIAQDGLQGQGAPVEAMRRLRVALETASRKGDTYSRRMWWLTIVLAALTLVQAIAVLPTVISVVRSWFTH
jgi:hypothetical protein